MSYVIGPSYLELVFEVLKKLGEVALISFYCMRGKSFFVLEIAQELAYRHAEKLTDILSCYKGKEKLKRKSAKKILLRIKSVGG